MSMSSIPSSSQSGKLYGWVERIGNKVPHPFLLFIYLIIVLMVTTAILSAFGVSAKNPTDGTPVVVKNLLSVEGLHWFLPNVIKNFSGFAPLGAILALVLGAGLEERVGLLPALMVKMASHVNARYASYMVLFIAFFSHISSAPAIERFIRSRTSSGVYPCPSKNINLVTADSVVLSYPETTPACNNWYPVS